MSASMWASGYCLKSGGPAAWHYRAYILQIWKPEPSFVVCEAISGPCLDKRINIWWIFINATEHKLLSKGVLMSRFEAECHVKWETGSANGCFLKRKKKKKKKHRHYRTHQQGLKISDVKKRMTTLQNHRCLFLTLKKCSLLHSLSCCASILPFISRTSIH